MDNSNHIAPEGSGYETALAAQIASWLGEHMHERLKVASVASQFKISAPTLQRLCRRYLHKSFQQYLGDIRMKKALAFIYQGLTVKEVMLKTGYRYRSTFNNAFRKKYKNPPRHFR